MKKTIIKRSVGTLLLSLGIVFLVLAFSIAAFNYYENIKASQNANELAVELNNAIGTSKKGVPDYLLNPNKEMPTIEIDGYLYIGTIYFPTLDIELPVMSTWSYEQLQIAPCRYEGSVYNGTAVIAAHNFDSHFGRLNKLDIGDEVVFKDVEGNMIPFNVAVKEVLAPFDVDSMVDSDYDLTLFTCTIGGAYRVTIRCELES